MTSWQFHADPFTAPLFRVDYTVLWADILFPCGIVNISPHTEGKEVVACYAYSPKPDKSAPGGAFTQKEKKNPST